MRCAGAGLGHLPYRLALAVGWVVALVLWLAFRSRMQEAQRRLRSALGDSAGEERGSRRLLWTAWRNLVFSGVDVLRLPHLTEDWVRRAVDYESVDILRTRLQQSGRVILAVPHMGSWELAGLAMHFFGLRMFYIVKRQKNLLADAYLNRLRSLRGFECLDRESKTLLRSVLRFIRDGKVLAILPDVRARDAALQVRFLGANASVMKGMALFAKLADAPILPACVLRQGWTRHRWQVFEPVYPDPAMERDADVQRMTQAVFDVFDRAVREHPDQYFWFNKRWVLESVAPVPGAVPAATAPQGSPQLPVAGLAAGGAAEGGWLRLPEPRTGLMLSACVCLLVAGVVPMFRLSGTVMYGLQALASSFLALGLTGVLRGSHLPAALLGNLANVGFVVTLAAAYLERPKLARQTAAAAVLAAFGCIAFLAIGTEGFVLYPGCALWLAAGLLLCLGAWAVPPASQPGAQGGSTGPEG